MRQSIASHYPRLKSLLAPSGFPGKTPLNSSSSLDLAANFPLAEGGDA